MGTCPCKTIYGDYMPYLWGHPKKKYLWELLIRAIILQLLKHNIELVKNVYSFFF